MFRFIKKMDHLKDLTACRPLQKSLQRSHSVCRAGCRLVHYTELANNAFNIHNSKSYNEYTAEETMSLHVQSALSTTGPKKLFCIVNRDFLNRKLCYIFKPCPETAIWYLPL